MIKFLTQGFARGFFRNPDVKSVELRPTKFTLSSGKKFQAQNVPRTRHSAPEGSKEWLLEETAALGLSILLAQDLEKRERENEFKLWSNEELQRAVERDDAIYGRNG